MILVLVSIIQYPPIFGKSLAILLQTPPAQSLVPIDDTTQWLHQNFPLRNDEYILSDVATQYAVRALLGTNFRWVLERRVPENLKSRIDSIGGAEGVLQRPEIAGVLALAKEPALSSIESLLGKASGHWQSNAVRENLRFFPSLEQELQPLIEHGWKKFSVPPWYTLYARPRETP